MNDPDFDFRATLAFVDGKITLGNGRIKIMVHFGSMEKALARKTNESLIKIARGHGHNLDHLSNDRIALYCEVCRILRNGNKR